MQGSGRESLKTLPSPEQGEQTVARRILVVEDDVDLLFLCSISLREAGHEVVECESAEQASAQLDGAIDLILLDIRLPGKSGLEFLAELPAGRPPVLMMSAHADGRVVEEAMGLGADGFIGKPFDPFELADQVAKHLPAI